MISNVIRGTTNSLQINITLNYSLTTKELILL
jgi:hypothetical protein